LSRAIADTSVFIAQETGRGLGDIPDEIAVSVITAAELELGVLRATDPDARAIRLSTLSRVQSTYPLLPIDPEVASCFARIAAAERDRGRRLRRHDTWIAATAMRHGPPCSPRTPTSPPSRKSTSCASES
jgi:hypothetical protein